MRLAMYEDALAALESAIRELSAEEYRAGRRLLDIAQAENGHFYLSQEQGMELFMVNTWTSVCRMLRHLAAAGVLQYHTNNMAYIIFPQWRQQNTTGFSTNTTGSQKNTTGFLRATTGLEGEEENDDQNATGFLRATTGFQKTPGDAEKTCGVGTNTLVSTLDLTTPESENELTNTAPPKRPNSDEAARSYGLLTDPDVGIDKVTARRFAAKHRFAYLLKQVCEWQREMAAGKVRSNGALVKRIDKGFGASLVPTDRASPIYLRHVPEEERQVDDTEEDRRRKYIPDEFADIIIG